MLAPWPIHTLVFDLDDTLYPERDFVLSGFAAVDEWLRRQFNASGFYQAAVNCFENGMRGKIFDEALPKIGLSPSPELIEGMLLAYRTHEPKLVLFPDAQDILAWASDRFNLGLITDGYAEAQARKIKALQLESIIGARIISDALGREFWKPSPAPYRKIMANFPGESAGYVYVGDNARKDFIGARGLGWKTVCVRRGTGENSDYLGLPHEHADVEITSLSELKILITCPPLR